MCADAPLELLEDLALTYLGSVPKSQSTLPPAASSRLPRDGKAAPGQVTCSIAELDIAMEFGKQLGKCH